MTTQHTTESRLAQLVHRNSMLQPHLRTTYPIELQEMLDLDENRIRSGSIQWLNSVGSSLTSASTASRSSTSESTRPAPRRTRSQTHLRQVGSSIENIRASLASASKASSSDRISTISQWSGHSPHGAQLLFDQPPSRWKRKQSMNLM